MNQAAPLSFEAVLKRTRPLADAGDGETGVYRLRPARWYLPETSASRTMPPVGGDWLSGQYQAEPPRKRPAGTRREPLPAPRSVDPRVIARELDLAGCGSAAALRLKRRQFARANHPDMVHPALGANATERMMVANRLIDQEIARRKRLSAPA